MERVIGRTIPPTLRKIFTQQSAALKFCWALPVDLPGGPRGLWGRMLLSLADLPTDFLNWSGWRATFETPLEHGWSSEWTVDAYRELFPLITAPNGDQIVVADRDEETSDLVLYLNHDGDGDFEFLILAETLEDFLRIWFQLGCPGPEWRDLVRFMDTKTDRLSLTTRRSAAWLRALSKGVL